MRLIPCLTPHGRLLLAPADEAAELEPAAAKRLIGAFARGAGHGLLQLGAAEVGQVLPPVFGYWREFSAHYVTALCTRPDVEERRNAIPPPSEEDLQRFALAAPAMPGAEYVTVAVLHSLWDELDEAFVAELTRSGATVQDFLKELNPAWNVVGRVHFNLADHPPHATLASIWQARGAKSRPRPRASRRPTSPRPRHAGHDAIPAILRSTKPPPT